MASSGFFDNAFCHFFYSPKRRYSTADRYSRRLVLHHTHTHTHTHTNLKAKLLETQRCCCLWWWEGKGQAWRQGSRRERESGSSVSQSVRHRERKRERQRDRERKQRSSSRNECKKRKKKEETEWRQQKRQNQTNQKNTKNNQIKVLACYFFRQLASCIHPLLPPPPPRWYQRTQSCSSCCFPRTNTHTHTHTLSLSLSLSKLESTTPWAPEKALEEYLYSGVISKVSWLGGQNSQFRHKRASNECGTGNENFTKRRNYKLTGTQTSFFHQFFLGGILSFLFPPERACTALLLLLLHIPLLLPVGLL